LGAVLQKWTNNEWVIDMIVALCLSRSLTLQQTGPDAQLELRQAEERGEHIFKGGEHLFTP